MVGMTTQERINDICAISGLSEDIVRRVMDAEKRSIVKSLRKGERANLIGRVVIRPEIRHKLQVGGEFENYIKLSASVASSLEAMLDDLNGFEAGAESSNNDVISQLRIMDEVRTSQISALV